jgi:OOP family OmpA-OmpF porin
MDMKTRFLTMMALTAMALAACAGPDRAPPPPPPPPPPPAMNNALVTVFFDYEKANLTATAADLVGSVLTRNGHLPGHELLIGFCDTAEHHCDRLGLRRAEAVKDELVRRGMPAAAVEVRVSMDLLVPTGHHVREPQNRRVVIDPR